MTKLSFILWGGQSADGGMDSWEIGQVDPHMSKSFFTSKNQLVTEDTSYNRELSEGQYSFLDIFISNEQRCYMRNYYEERDGARPVRYLIGVFLDSAMYSCGKYDSFLRQMDTMPISEIRQLAINSQKLPFNAIDLPDNATFNRKDEFNRLSNLFAKDTSFRTIPCIGYNLPPEKGGTLFPGLPDCFKRPRKEERDSKPSCEPPSGNTSTTHTRIKAGALLSIICFTLGYITCASMTKTEKNDNSNRQPIESQNLSPTGKGESDEEPRNRFKKKTKTEKTGNSNRQPIESQNLSPIGKVENDGKLDNCLKKLTKFNKTISRNPKIKKIAYTSAPNDGVMKSFLIQLRVLIQVLHDPSYQTLTNEIKAKNEKQLLNIFQTKTKGNERG